MWDLLIKNALLFDGSGGSPRVCDVAVRDGRIAGLLDHRPAHEGERAGWPAASDKESPPLGRNDDARHVIDARGLWLTPGLLDIHTHFDLEVELDPRLPEAVRHGTTTVVMSNCSLGLAFGAQREDDQNPIVDCFARVENVPKSVLQKVVDRVDWKDPAGYFQHLDQLPLGPNVVPMIPHSMLRIEVMGLKDSISRNPTAAELKRMTELLEDGMREGYAGFSTDALPFHYLANQPNTRRKIPAQYGSFRELRTLTDVVRRFNRVWQATPPKDNPIAVLRNFLLTSGRLFGSTLKITAVAAMDLVTNRSIIQLVVLLTRLLNSKFLRGKFVLQALPASFKVWGEGAITPLAEEI
ncbi:MAG: amidohydrolase family protein, partial [Leptospirales bacterium]